MGRLNGKVAVVTGASRGIGKAIAKLLAAEGAKVVCAARTLQEGESVLEGSVNTTVLEIQEIGGISLAVAVNVTDEQSCTHLVEVTRQNFGPVDLLVNNAGTSYFSPIKDIPLKRWMVGFAVNMHGPFILSQKVLPDMIQRRSGAIINISSAAAVVGTQAPYKTPGVGETMYAATKAALNRFTQGLAQEVYQYGITVASVSPSLPVITPGVMHQKLVAGPDDSQSEPPEMMARAVLLLATEPIDKVSGRITYSQSILKEFGWIKDGMNGFMTELPRYI